MTQPDRLPPGVDPTKPSGGRIYDYMLGGTEHLEVDRQAAERIKAAAPEVEDWAWANRGFLQRATRWLAEQGIRQFIDLGAGLPTGNNTHEAAQAVAPDVRVVYADNDPIIAAHANHLLTGSSNTVFILGDLRDPGGILDLPEVGELIDFDEPAALLLVSVMHFVADELDPWGLVAAYMDRLAPGSYLVLSHGTGDRNSPAAVQTVKDAFAGSPAGFTFRSKPDVERFFAGLALVPPYAGAEPGIVHTGIWGAEDPSAADSDGSRWGYCGVARKTGPGA